MKKICSLFLCILYILGSLSSCAYNAVRSHAPVGIPFVYFYRGFTPLNDSTDTESFKEVSGTRIILTADDWYDYCDRFCHGAYYFIDVDYTKECLIAISYMYGAKPSHNYSSDIKEITVKEGLLNITYEDNPSERIYVLNIDSGHWFVNVVKVSIIDLLPVDEIVYTNQWSD